MVLACSNGLSTIDLLTQLRADASETGRGGSSVMVAASFAALSAASLPGHPCVQGPTAAAAAAEKWLVGFCG